MNVNILKLNDPEYPAPLVNIYSPPKQLYWAGIKPQNWIDKPKVAIVGSRKATPYGRNVTTKLANELARAGVVIISGLAYGIDIIAHRAALDVSGRTVAVLPTGLDNIYPTAHRLIADHITYNGTLLTEYGPQMAGFKSNFIARNRIVSGLADVLLITEAAVNSGSLHTASFALQQGKTVMAVPGNINSPISEGCNNLIKSGAVPATSAEDIFFALKIKPESTKGQNFNGTDLEKTVLSLIKEGVTAQDELAAAAQLNPPNLSWALTMLEISGYIRPAGGGSWVAS